MRDPAMRKVTEMRDPAMRKVVINTCFGGFGLSAKAVEVYLGRQGKQVWWFTDARDENGTLDLKREKVPTDDPDGVYMSYSYTSSEPTDDAYFYHRDIPRDDPDLVAVVEELGEAADGTHAELMVVEIPADADWEIDEYDGTEHVAEKHRTWR